MHSNLLTANVLPQIVGFHENVCKILLPRRIHWVETTEGLIPFRYPIDYNHPPYRQKGPAHAYD